MNSKYNFILGFLIIMFGLLIYVDTNILPASTSISGQAPLPTPSSLYTVVGSYNNGGWDFTQFKDKDGREFIIIHDGNGAGVGGFQLLPVEPVSK